MHHYPHHIGDFNNATRHLTRVERSIYRDLIELYYDSEKPLNPDIKFLCRKIIARDEQEVTAVEQVLSEFFVLSEKGYINNRCEHVIYEYQTSIHNKSKAGRASAEARKAKKTKKNLTPVEQPLDKCSTGVSNQEPGTNNHKPEEQELLAQSDESLNANPPIFEIILNDKSIHPINQFDIDKYTELYPAVDIHQQFRNIIGWCDSNPTKRKTKTGVKRFINAWLTKEQDRGGRYGTHRQSNRETAGTRLVKEVYGTPDQGQARRDGQDGLIDITPVLPSSV